MNALTLVTYLTAIASFIAGLTRAFWVISIQLFSSIVADIFRLQCQT